ncbi:MAG: aminotransferase class V-fold PLP-dependent enzyme [Ruminococcus sp.]|jgi:cysteine desulfurase family protein|nr:aminotransferase class V-fold PLP-dependent enzyme [Ruminococcus sp.]
MVNFDNAATTYPKPQSVLRAFAEAPINYGGNPGRSGHALSVSTSNEIYKTREKIAAMFGGFPENTAFTLNCTYALNFAIKGIPNGHIVISDLEHNAVARPVYAKTGGGAAPKMSVAHIDTDPKKTLDNIRRKLTRNTKAVVMTLGSNITGQITPFSAVGDFCRKNNLIFIADGAQAAGVIPINIERNNINFLCCPGHKGLYGPAGTGFILSDGKYKLSPIIQGGTGSASLELTQPGEMPDALESGTVNTAGIIALGAGIDFVNSMGLSSIYSHESELCNIFIEGLKKMPGITIYRNNEAAALPIVLFNKEGIDSNALADKLSDKGFALRGGLHCAGIAHKSIGTAPAGALRFSPSVFNTAEEVVNLLKAI